MILNSNSVEKEILFDQRLNDGSSALMLAIESNNVRLIQFMMENNVNEGPRNDGKTIPMSLTNYSQNDLVKHFLENGHDIFAKDDQGRDILYHLISKWRPNYEIRIKLFEFLIHNGLSPNHKFILMGGEVKSLVHHVLFQTELAVVVIRLGADYMKFRKFKFFTHRLKREIREFGCEIQDPTEIIPFQNDPVKYLFLSVIHNRMDILKEILIQLDCTELRDSSGDNILGVSLISYRMNIFEFIMKQLNWKTMMKHKNNEGLLPIHIALQRNNYVAVRTFCECNDEPLNIDRLCFQKTRIHRELFYFLRQWKLIKISKSMDTKFHFQ
jgi:hypothetical protein